MFNWLRRNFWDLVFVLILLVLVSVISYRSYAPGTWLTGWDNLHPEFDLKLNIERSLSAVWQEYQGVGLLGGMGHAADLPRQLVLWGLSAFLPLNLLRYYWVFLMLLLGPLGAYFLTKFLVGERGKLGGSIASFVAVLFYLLNLATVQYFYTPLETFVSFYGFIPWLLLFSLKFFTTGSKRNLIYLFISSILAASAFYVQTMFIVFLFTLMPFCVSAILEKRASGLVRVLKLGIVIFAANAFWLLPVAYFGITSGNVPGLAKINSIATPETQLMNQARGNFSDVALLKGYWFDYYDFKPDGKFEYLYSDWIEYLKNPMVGYLGYFLFGSAIIGLFLGIFNKNVRFRFALPLLLLICYIMLATTNPPFGEFYKLLSDKIPLFSEFFRNVFTKWSGVASLVYAIGIGVLVSSLTSLLGRFKSLTAPVIAALIFSIFAVAWPAFDGKLIYKSMRLNLPNEYFEMFNFFDGKPHESRVAFFPIHTFWGWNYYDWGGNGSGFIWYGIKQPILDRAFDVWSPEGESFYNQMLLAIERNDLSAFDKTLEKYQVRYLILDNSVTAPGVAKRNLNLEESRDLISRSNHIKSSQSFGFLNVFETQLRQGFAGQADFVSTPEFYTRVNANLTYSESDPLYSRFGTYIFDKNATSFPFVNLDRRGQVKIGLESVHTESERSVGRRLRIENKETGSAVLLPTDSVIREGFGQNQGYPEAKNCDLKGKGSAVKKRLSDKTGNFYGAYDGGVSCDYFYYPDVSFDRDYLVRISGENLKGRGLKIYLENVVSKRIEVIELLPTGKFDQFIPLPGKHTIIPVETYPTGYTLSVETRSFGKVASENEITGIEFYPVDFDFLANVKIGGEPQEVKNNLTVKNVKKYGTWLYVAEVEGDGLRPEGASGPEGLIELGQGYDQGWVALINQKSNIKNQKYISKIKNLLTNLAWKKLEHTKVNSWANGWMVPANSLQSTDYSSSNAVGSSQSTVVIFFWPQLLEYLGFGILLLTSVILIVYVKSEKG